MNQHIDPDLASDPELASAIHQATTILELVVGESADTTRAEWRLDRDDRDRRLIELRLSDFSGSVVGHFAPNEFDAPRHLKVRLYGLWGDLLQKRSQSQLKEVRSLLDRIERTRIARD